MIALDASALLAFMFREPGYEQVAGPIEESALSTVNLSEVLGRFVQLGRDPQQVLDVLDKTNIKLVSFDRRQAQLAAALLTKSRPLGLSCGDRACLALALVQGIPVLTADRAWANADFGVEVRLIR